MPFRDQNQKMKRDIKKHFKLLLVFILYVLFALSENASAYGENCKAAGGTCYPLSYAVNNSACSQSLSSSNDCLNSGRLVQVCCKANNSSSGNTGSGATGTGGSSTVLNSTPNRCQAGETSACVNSGCGAVITTNEQAACTSAGRTACSALTTSTTTYSLVEPISSDDTCPAGQLLCCGKNVSSSSGAGTSATSSSASSGNCSGTCFWASCPMGKVLSSNASEYCASVDYVCCVQSNASSSSSSSGQGVLANNCSGTCRSDCTAAGEILSSNLSEYCGTSGYECCVTSNSSSSSSSNSSTSASSSWGNIFSSSSSSASGIMWNSSNLNRFGLPSGRISGIIGSVFSWLMYIFGFLGIIAFVIAGIFYLTAAGDAEQEKKAKLVMKMGIIGIVVGLIGLVVIQAVNLMLNAGIDF